MAKGGIQGAAPQIEITHHLYLWGLRPGSFATLRMTNPPYSKYAWLMFGGKVRSVFFRAPKTLDSSTLFKINIQEPDMFQWFSRYDYLFWFEHGILDSLGFEPSYLKIEMSVSDSTGNQIRTIADSARINTR